MYDLLEGWILYNFRTLYDCDFHQKRVLLRVDFNVPMNEQGDVTNDKRIRETLPTIKYLRQQGAMVILLTHIGRPKGRDSKLQTDCVWCTKDLSFWRIYDTYSTRGTAFAQEAVNADCIAAETHRPNVSIIRSDKNTCNF